MIKAQKIYKSYNKRAILKDIELDVKEKEFVCLVGESGSGKTTLLKIIAGLIAPDRGEIYIQNEKLNGVNFKTSFIFQNGALLPWLNVKENISFPFKLTGQNCDPKEVDNIINEVGLKNLSEKYPRDLSGGQRQRVGIARALIVKRPILLLDEPFSALDVKTATELHNELLDIWKQRGLTVIMVSHSVEEAVALADRIVLLKDGVMHSRLKIDLPRPRDQKTKEFIELVDKLTEILES